MNQEELAHSSPDSALTPEQREAVVVEESHLEKVHRSIAEQSAMAAQKLATESERARELTSALVATRRAEDKQMLASDEAVAHALKDRKAGEIEELTKIMDRPYFARIEVEEQTESGPRTFEYKIGFRANPESRIIDWRKAPLSKIYYNYQEGDEYSEEVQGRERTGKVLLRNRVEIERGILRKVHCRLGDFILRSGAWESLGRGGGSRVSSSYRQLPTILSLITPEQFSLITEDQTTALLVQGVAGSGKTTVALHRLSYLIKGDAQHFNEEQAAIVVRSRALRSYVQNSLPQLDIEDVPVLLYEAWALQQLGWTSVGGAGDTSTASVPTPPLPCPASIDRVKSSLALLYCVEAVTSRRLASSDLPTLRERISSGVEQRLDYFLETLNEALKDPRQLLSHDDTRLLDLEVIRRTADRVAQQQRERFLDRADYALMVRVLQILQKAAPQDFSLTKFEHLVVDEVQDYSAPQLASLIGAVRHLSGLTLVGDLGQQVAGGVHFPVWEKLRDFWGFGPELARFVALEVSHRSTEQIMRLAHSIRREKPPAARGQRQGRVPIWFRCDRESKGIQTAIEWLTKATNRYPTSLTAVLTRSDEEARLVLSLLKPTFGEIIRAGDSVSFSLEEGIIVTSVEHVKGLEFCNVVIWNPTRRHYHEDPDDRNLLYVAVTRAEENLCLVTWGAPSPFLPHFTSGLVRGIRLAEEEDEES